MSANNSHCQAHSHGSKPWNQNPLLYISLLAVLLIGLSYFIPAFKEFRFSFFEYIGLMWWAVGLGLLLGGLMDYYLPQEYISKYLAKRNKSAVFYAVALGFLMSACSHGILALSMELHKKGASGPAVISFLLASPWTSLPITFMLIGFFGAKAFLLMGTALLIAIITGLFFQFLDYKGWIEKNQNSVTVDKDFSIRKDIVRRLKAYEWSGEQLKKDVQGIWKGVLSLSDMVLWWMVLGLVVASLISAFVPGDVFMKYFGPTITGLLVTLLLAIVLEVCSEGTAPLAFEIFNKTGAFGNTFAFLMGGVVTDYTEIGLIWINIGKRTAMWMVAVAIPQVLFFAWLFNRLFQ